MPAFKGADNFINTFPQATGVECKVKGEFTEVSFTWQGLKLQAFYDREGNQDVDNNLNYYVTVINIKTTLLLHVSADGSLSVFKKMKN